MDNRDRVTVFSEGVGGLLYTPLYFRKGSFTGA